MSGLPRSRMSAPSLAREAPGSGVEPTVPAPLPPAFSANVGRPPNVKNSANASPNCRNFATLTVEIENR